MREHRAPAEGEAIERPLIWGQEHTMSSQIDTARIRPDGPGAYLVPSATNDRVAYRITLSPRHCTCPAFAYRSGPCKHLSAVEDWYTSTPIEDEPDMEPELAQWYAKATRLDLEDILQRTCERMGGKHLDETPLGHVLQAWQSEPPCDPYRPVMAPHALEAI